MKSVLGGSRYGFYTMYMCFHGMCLLTLAALQSQKTGFDCSTYLALCASGSEDAGFYPKPQTLNPLTLNNKP